MTSRQKISSACLQLAAWEPPDCVRGSRSVFARLATLQDAFNSLGTAACQKEICELTPLPFIGYKLVVDMDHKPVADAQSPSTELLFYTDEGFMKDHGKKVTVTVDKTEPYSNGNVQELEISRLGEIALKIANYILNKPKRKFDIGKPSAEDGIWHKSQTEGRLAKVPLTDSIEAKIGSAAKCFTAASAFKGEHTRRAILGMAFADLKLLLEEAAQLNWKYRFKVDLAESQGEAQIKISIEREHPRVFDARITTINVPGSLSLEWNALGKQGTQPISSKGDPANLREFIRGFAELVANYDSTIKTFSRGILSQHLCRAIEAITVHDTANGRFSGFSVLGALNDTAEDNQAVRQVATIYIGKTSVEITLLGRNGEEPLKIVFSADFESDSVVLIIGEKREEGKNRDFGRLLLEAAEAIAVFPSEI